MVTTEQVIEATKVKVTQLMSARSMGVLKGEKFEKSWYKIGGIELTEKDYKLTIINNSWELTKDQYTDLASSLENFHQEGLKRILEDQILSALGYIGL